MALRNEIFEGIAAYKALAPTGADAYYDYMRQQAQEAKRKEDKVREKGQAGVPVTGTPAAKPPPVPGTSVPNQSSTATPGTTPAGGALAVLPPPTHIASQQSAGIGSSLPFLPPLARSLLDQSAGQALAVDPSASPYGRLSMSGAARGGRISRYQRGGSVPSFREGGSYQSPPVVAGPQRGLNYSPADTPEDDPSPEEIEAKILDMIGMPQQGPSPVGQLNQRGEVDRRANIASLRGAQARDATAFQTQPPLRPYDLKGVSRAPVPFIKAQEALAKPDVPAPGPSALGAGEHPIEEPTSSAVGDWWRRRVGTPESNAYYKTLTDELAELNDPWTQRTAKDKAAVETRRAEIMKSLAELQKGNYPGKPTPIAPEPSAASARSDSVTPTPGSALQTGDPFADKRLPPYETKRHGYPDPEYGGAMDRAPRTALPKPPPPPPPPAAPKTGGGSTGPGSGNAESPAPPGGAAGVNTPSTAPKRLPLDSQQRTERYDPTLDADDRNNKGYVDASGRVTQAGVTQLFQGIARTEVVNANGIMPAVGSGAMSRPGLQRVIAGFNLGGRLSDGDAILRGMLAVYRHRLEQGDPVGAAKMAMSIMQAANLEAAALGRHAYDQLMGGDANGAKQTAIRAANVLPDGMHHSTSADGQFLISVDPTTGKPTGKIPLGGKQLLALISGIADGSALWAALMQSVEALKTPDKNAEGRALSNKVKSNQILLQEQLLNKRAAGKGGAAGKTQSADVFDQIYHGRATGGGTNQAAAQVINQTSEMDAAMTAAMQHPEPVPEEAS